MVETIEDILYCSALIDRGEELGWPDQLIRDLRAWLEDNVKRLM